MAAILIDGSLPGFGSAYIPKERVPFPRTADVLARIQQLRVQAIPPPNVISPISVTRRLTGPGTFEVRVQFSRNPSDPTYQGTTAFLKTQTGTQIVQATGGNGPLVFTVNKTTQATSVLARTDNTNASSSTDFGSGNSRALLLT